LLVIISFAFMPPKVQAAEVTTDLITTEEVTTNEEGIIADSVEETWLNVKDVVMAAVLSLLGLGTVSTVGGIVIGNLIKKSFAAIDSAVEQNKISQSTADMATKIIDDGVDLIQAKLTKFEENVGKQITGTNQSVQELVNTFGGYLGNINQALIEYFTEEEE